MARRSSERSFIGSSRAIRSSNPSAVYASPLARLSIVAASRASPTFAFVRRLSTISTPDCPPDRGRISPFVLESRVEVGNSPAEPLV